MTTTAPPAAAVLPDPVASRHLATRVAGAALAVGIAYIHVKDQGGFPGDKTPSYVGNGYYVLEAVAVLVAVALLVVAERRRQLVWLGALAVAAGPLVGFVLSRGPGLPSYSDDKGNWTEALGLVSVAVEVALLVLAVLVLRGTRARGQ